MATKVDMVANMMPWVGGLVPAAMTFENVQAHLSFTLPEALIVAAVVEGIGFVSVTTALDWYEMGAGINGQAQGQPQRGWMTAQFWVAVAGSALYLVAVLGVNAILDDGNIWRRLTLGLLSTFGVVGGVMVALRNQLTKQRAAAEERDVEIRAEKERLIEERRSDRKEKREMRLAGKRLELELRVTESNKSSLPVTAGLSEGSVSSVVNVNKSLRWSLLNDSDKQRVIAIVRECQATNGELWKKPAAVTVRVAFGLDERQSYKWLEYAERDADKFAEVTA